jgi:hypothetical protein
MNCMPSWRSPAIRGHVVTDQPSDTNDGGLFPIDLSVARLARIENVLAGGEANFAIDRAAAETLAEASPTGLEGLRGVIEALKAFVARAVRFLAGEVGVRQYLHIGMSTPTTGMVHDVAWQIVPDARVVYASYDPTTLAHVHSLGSGASAGAVAHVHSSFDDPQEILHQAAATLDFGRPVAVILPTTLNLIVDDDLARRIVDELRDAMAPGSHLVFAHTSLDIAGRGTAKVIELLNQAMSESYVVRTEGEIARFLDGFDLVKPGLVPVEQWRNDDDPPILENGRSIPIYGAVGGKP